MSIQPAPTPFLRGPYLQAAAFCETVIEGRDGVLSLIRLTDRLMVQASGIGAPQQMPEITHNMVAVIALKSGEARGTYPVRLVMERPSGLRSDVATATVILEGEGDRGQNIIFRFSMVFQDQGLYWFDVYVNDVLMTRMPWRVVYLRTTPGGPALQP